MQVNQKRRMQRKLGAPKPKRKMPKTKMPKRMPSGDSIIRKRSTEIAPAAPKKKQPKRRALEKEMPGPAQRKLAPKAEPKSKG